MNLQKHKNSFASIVLFVALFGTVQTPVAVAATLGSGNCVQTVDSTSGVAVTESGNYCYVAFKAGTRIWSTPSNVSSIDYLVVAGGGSGGSRHGGGGGAGGLVRGSGVSLSGITSVSISVGEGASSPTRTSGFNYIVGTKGSNSSISKNAGSGGFNTVTAIGGGGGAAGGSAPQYGGSGGGSQSLTASTFESGQGNQGGLGNYVNGSWYSSGGGGGAGDVGLDYTSTSGGAGGIGAIWISAFTNTIATALGLVQTNQISVNQVYFAGGGGGSTTASTAGNGGLGGGGAAVLGNGTGNSGTANSGGGGGASGCCDGGASGAGGSGIIMLRYLYDVTPPSFTNSTTFSFAENTVISSNAATISVNESSTITINSGSDSALFSLVVSDSVTARIRFLNSPNFESPTDVGVNNGYELSIRATDSVGNFSNQSITINITNVNEAPMITVANSSSNAIVSRAETTTVVFTYTGSDSDTASNLIWSISGTDVSFFTIDSSTGALRFVTLRDFEAPADSDRNNTYVVTLTLSDGALSDSQTLTVTITNANESATIDAPTTSGTLRKGVTTTISITANATGKVRFFVGGKRITNCLAQSMTGSYPNFSATCSWKPPVTGSQNLTARVTPTDSTFSATTSAATSVWVAKRATTR